MVIENVRWARYSLVSSICYKFQHGWTLRKNFKIEVLRRLENGIFILVFVRTIHTSFNHMSLKNT